MQESGTSVSDSAAPDPFPPLSQPSSTYSVPQPRKTTRSKTANYGSLATLKTKEDLLANPLYLTKVTTRKLAQTCLAENSLLPPNWDPSLPDLVMVVLNLAYTIPNLGAIGAEALRAVAILLDTHPERTHLSATTAPPTYSPASTQTDTTIQSTPTTDTNVDQHSVNLGTQVDHLQSVIDALHIASLVNTSSSEVLTRAIDVARDDLHGIAHTVNESVEELTAIPAAIKESARDPLPQPRQATPYRNAVLGAHNDQEQMQTSRLTPLRGRAPAPQASFTTPTYPAIDHMKANAALKDRQILLDFEPDHPTLSKNPTKRQLIDFFQKAISKLDDTGKPIIHIKAISTTKNKSPIIELNSPEAANWLKDPSRRRAFLDHLGGKVLVKDRLYHLVVPFLPTSVRTDDAATLRSIERESDIAEHSASRMKWIKDPSRRGSRQRVAHALLSITSPQAANQLIKEGLYLDQTKYHPRKDRKEPLRCLKCQRWGHFLSSCTQAKDTCGMCAHDHRDRDCNSFETYYCVNCESDTHSSKDRNCPDFQRRCAELDARAPDNAMPYFPTEEPWTQVLLPPRPDGPIILAQPPPQRAHEPRPAYRQQTLGRAPDGRSMGLQATNNHTRPHTAPSPPPPSTSGTPDTHSTRPCSLTNPEPPQEDTPATPTQTTPRRPDPEPFPAPSPLHQTPRPRSHTGTSTHPIQTLKSAPPLSESSPPSSPTLSLPGSLPLQNSPTSYSHPR